MAAALHRASRMAAIKIGAELRLGTCFEVRADLEVRAGFEFLVAAIDFCPGKRPEAVHSEFFAAETAHYGTVDNGAAQLRYIDVAVLQLDAASRQVADEAARETIARAGRVEH